jgi:protein-tyrosine phosphatase
MPEFTISEITDYLYISSFPGPDQLEQIRAMGVRLILSLYLRKPNKVFGEPPLNLLWMPVVDSPVTPLPLSVFMRGVQAALPVIEKGDKVLVHCKWGVHRSAAMASCILIAKGSSSTEAVELVKRQRAEAKPDDGYVLARIMKFEVAWIRQLEKASTIDPR